MKNTEISKDTGISFTATLPENKTTAVGASSMTYRVIHNLKYKQFRVRIEADGVFDNELYSCFPTKGKAAKAAEAARDSLADMWAADAKVTYTETK